ncbi:MAG: efflux RND transporter permease subunit [Aaplasma endosymbiont of Hyalomma asiaticum]
MNAVTSYFLSRNKFTLFLLLFIVVCGFYSYFALPRERTPTIKVPVISIVVTADGMSGKIAEKLLALPIEKEVRVVSGIKKMLTMVEDGKVTIAVHFRHDTDIRDAMEKVRAQLDVVRPKLPREVTSLAAHELDLGLLPVLHIAVTGDIQNSVLSDIAREMKSRIEGISDVLRVDTEGLHEYVIEINFFPELIDHYGVQIQDIQRALVGSYPFVEYGVLEGDTGSHKVKLAGELDSYKKIMNLVLKTSGNKFVTISNVADVKLANKNSHEFVRVNGKSAVVLKISKRVGSSVTDVVDKVRAIVNNASSALPRGVSVLFLQDQAQEIRLVLHELENTLVFSVILVLVVMMAFMGIRTSILVAVSIPVSALLGIAVIYLLGYTLNIVILFTLIMVIGMLVDDAIVVSEYADRKIAQGFNSLEAYRQAAASMFWPVAASTTIRLSVFIPLLFWPGVMGEFMKYIPAVSISTLVSSWLMALVFTPVLGSMFSKSAKASVCVDTTVEDFRGGPFGRFVSFYEKILGIVLDHPKKFIIIVSSVLFIGTACYFVAGPGVEFFPDVEPDRATITVKGDNNLSVRERKILMEEVENRASSVAGVKHIHTRSGTMDNSDEAGVIGVVNLEFEYWTRREKSNKVMKDVAVLLKDIRGISFDIAYQSMKPSHGKHVEISLKSSDLNALGRMADLLEKSMSKSQGFIGVSVDRSISGIEWVIDIDRRRARSEEVDVAVIGKYVKMLTDGLLVGKYYPKDSTDEIDIVARFNREHRTLKDIDNLQISTPYGLRKVASFIKVSAEQSPGVIKRVDGSRAITISSYVSPGYSIEERVRYIKGILHTNAPKDLYADFTGDVEYQHESKKFLIKAFSLVVFMIVLILMAEFNSPYYVMVIMSAVFLSTTCVFLGFLLTYKVFGVVMGGVGIIVLAGVVVNNNILLIDAFCTNIGSSCSRREAIIKSAISRLRPIFLTVITGVLGLLPMVLKISVDFIDRRILYDSPASQLWFELSTTTSMGLLLATVITLLFTPALLMCGKDIKSLV